MRKKRFQFRIWHLLLATAVMACIYAKLRWSLYGGTNVGIRATGLDRVEELSDEYRSNIKLVWLMESDRERLSPDVVAYDDNYVISRLDNLRQLENLSEVRLDGSAVTSNAVERICELKNVRSLFLNSTPLDDSVVPILSRADHLRYLNVTGSNISDTGMKELKTALPNCEIPLH